MDNTSADLAPEDAEDVVDALGTNAWNHDK